MEAQLKKIESNIRSNEGPNTLNTNGIKIPPEAALQIADALRGNTSIMGLELSGESFPQVALKAVFENIASHPTLGAPLTLSPLPPLAPLRFCPFTNGV